MKTIFFLAILLFVFSLGAGVLAQETELPDPGLTPDSPFYFLETMVEEIVTLFTFGDLKKAERHALLAAERLAEAQAVAGKGKPALTEKTLERYEKQLQNSIARAEKAQAKGRNTEKVMEVVAKVGQATSKHIEVLAEVSEKVPQEDRAAVEGAMAASLRGHAKAVEVLKAENALGDVPEEVSLPEKVPQEVRERVQMRAQQELEAMKALEGVDLSKSLRDICAEQGGTPEMCAEFPAQKFKSFKQIEAFCTEKGGPSEICTTLEDKCRELGVTEANECFILLSVSSVRTYAATELKTSPAPSLSPEDTCSGGMYSDGKTKWCCKDSDGSYSPEYVEMIRVGEAPLLPTYYQRKGTVEYKIINLEDGTVEQGIERDSCYGNTLTEWMCPTRLDRETRNERYSEQYNCSLGCQDGACIREETETEREPAGEQTTISLQGAYIGVLFSSVNDEMQASRGLSVNYGALIMSVVPDSPAASAGLQKNDIILEFDGVRITEDNSLTEMLSRSEAGASVVLKVLRGEGTIMVNVKLTGGSAN